MTESEFHFNVEKDMVIYAFRYALGRRTYATGIVSDFLIKNWDKFPDYDQFMIKREIKEVIENKNAGQKIDVDGWKRVLLLK